MQQTEQQNNLSIKLSILKSSQVNERESSNHFNCKESFKYVCICV